MFHSPFDSYSSNEYLAYLNNLQRLQQFKPLVVDGELHVLAAKVRERLSVLGAHGDVPGYELSLMVLESGLFYEESECIRAELKAQLEGYVNQLDELLSRHGSQREREVRRAESIAADRQRIVTYAWHRSAVSFTRHPNRWFDPVPEDEFEG